MAQCEHGVRRQTCSVCKPDLVFKMYERSARDRRLIFALTESDFAALVNESCAYCGKWPSRGIDRRDNRVGYVIKNCVSCCGTCNRAKGTMGHDEYINHILTQAAHIQRQRELRLAQQKYQQRMADKAAGVTNGKSGNIDPEENQGQQKGGRSAKTEPGIAPDPGRANLAA